MAIFNKFFTRLFLLVFLGLGTQAFAAGGGGNNVFFSLEPLVVNLATPDDKRYLQVTIAFETTDPVAFDTLKTYGPIIRSRTLLTLSTKKADDLTSIEGKQRLLDELLELARYSIPNMTEEKVAGKGVSNVHLTSFVIQ